MVKRVLVPETLVTSIVAMYHESEIYSHSGVLRTMALIKRDYVCSHLRHYVERYISSCDVCQAAKSRRVHTARVPRPLPVPDTKWHSVSIGGNRAQRATPQGPTGQQQKTAHTTTQRQNTHSTAHTAQGNTAKRRTKRHTTPQHGTTPEDRAQHATAPKSATKNSTAPRKEHSAQQYGTTRDNTTQRSAAQHQETQHNT